MKSVPLTRDSRGWILLAFGLLVLSAFASCNRQDLTDGNNIQHAPEGPAEPPPKPPCSPPSATGFPIKINEVMVLNESTLADGEGKFSPWLELYNSGDTEFDVGGTPLSDDFADSQKWKVPCIAEAVLPPHGFLVIFLDGTSEPNTLHANFTISNDKEETELILNRGANFFRFDSTLSEPDVAVGRNPDGVGRVNFLSEPTPGAPNSAVRQETEARFVRGDANGDGRMTVSDVAVITKVASGETPPPACQDRLDANDDGAITAADALYVRDALFVSGPKPPAPFPEPGLDPTPDDLRCPAE